MSELNVGIAVVGIGGWYPRGVARMIQQFHEVSAGFTIAAWVNCYPPGSASHVIENVDYGPYMAKPMALRDLEQRGFDVGILLDAAFYPIRHIQPLVDHVCEFGYYFCKNGYMVGEWSSDKALKEMRVSRDAAMNIEEISSYCVGLDLRWDAQKNLLNRWCESRVTFPGPHTNAPLYQGRNPGWCSDDPRCKGHRHDQTALSILAHQMEMNRLVERPRFTAYLGYENETTVLVNQGL